MGLELWLLFILIIALIATIFTALVYFGCFHSIEVKVGHSPIDFSGKRIAYKAFESAYGGAGGAFTELYALLAKNVPNFINEQLTTIGVYYDDPNKVTDVNRCRYIVGVVMPNDDKTFTYDYHNFERLLTDNDYKFATLPSIDHVVHTLFPYKGALSIVIAIKRVYPMLNQFINEHNLCAHPSIELYKGDHIYFILPLAKQDQFYFIDNDDDLSDQHSDTSHNGSGDEETKSSSLKEPETNGSQSDNAMSSQSSRSSFEELTIDGRD